MYCENCGSSISDNQGKSCLMCYDDKDYDMDEYYREWIEEQERKKYYEELEKDWSEDDWP